MAKTKQQHNVKSRKPSIANISGILGVSVVCLFSVTGCDWFGNKNEEPKTEDGSTVKPKTPDNKTTEDGGIHLEPVANAENACTNIKVNDGLKKSVQTYISQQSNTLATTYANDAKVTLDSNQINTDGVTVVVENIKASPKQAEGKPINCQATLKMTLPDDDVARANQLYADNKGKSLQQRLAGSSLTLEGNTLVDNNFAFTVDPKTTDSLPQISGQPLVVGAVAGVLANSAIKASKSSSSSAKNTTPKTITPNTSSPEAQQKSAAEAKRRAARIAKQKAARVAKQKAAKIAKQKAAKVAKQKAAKIAKQKADIIAKQKADATKTKKAEYSLASDGVSAKENKAKTKAAFKAKEKTPKAEVTPKAKPVPKKVAKVKNDKIEMVIEESDDTY